LYSGVRTHGFVIDEVAEPWRRIPLGTLKERFRKKSLFFLYSGVSTQIPNTLTTNILHIYLAVR
jgi:hypothetical protein